MEKKKERKLFGLGKTDILIILLLTALFLSLRTYVITPVKVEGHSMDPTLETGEKLLTYKLHTPTRGDIITFKSPLGDGVYVKRVIAVGGETVEVKDDTLYINGKEVEEPYLEEQKGFLGEGESLTYDFDPVKVKKGEYFVMGDNRLNSSDSRLFGTIKEDSIQGVILGRE